VQLDKFDRNRHFRDTFPILAQTRPHLKYSLLSLSAGYLVKVDSTVSPSLSLALYQHAIHLLLPKLHLRDIAVIASCTVLCVLEMFSCESVYRLSTLIVRPIDRLQARQRPGAGTWTVVPVCSKP